MNSKIHGLLLRSLPRLYEEQTLDQLPRHIVGFLTRLISTDVLAYNEIDLQRGRAKVVINVVELENSPYFKVFESLMDQHPLIQYQQRTGDMSARKISDFLSRTEYHRSVVYNEVYRHLDGEDQFAFSLQLTRHSAISLAMNRSARRFTEEDRSLLNLLQPHLIQAYRNAETRTALQGQIQTLRHALEDLPQGLVILDRRLRLQHATQRARQLLKKYFPATTPGHQLPPTLRAWMLHTCHWLGQSLPTATTDFSISSPAGTLIVQLVRQPEGAETLLRLEERGVPLSAKPLEALKLTPRQAEVLLWVAQGKRTPEIAVILGAAPRTVQKHLESIFAKLGVESRTAAARRALEVLGAAPVSRE